jgi:cytochrome bd-type quinol oxidase subunit 1
MISHLTDLLFAHISAAAVLIGGLFVNTSSAVIWAATGDNDIAPWTTIGSNAAVVAALIFFAKEFVKGRIVAEPIDDLLRESAKREERWLQETKIREERTAALAQRSQEREDRIWALVGKAPPIGTGT